MKMNVFANKVILIIRLIYVLDVILIVQLVTFLRIIVLIAVKIDSYQIVGVQIFILKIIIIIIYVYHVIQNASNANINMIIVHYVKIFYQEIIQHKIVIVFKDIMKLMRKIVPNVKHNA